MCVLCHLKQDTVIARGGHVPVSAGPSHPRGPLSRVLLRSTPQARAREHQAWPGLGGRTGSEPETRSAAPTLPRSAVLSLCPSGPLRAHRRGRPRVRPRAPAVLQVGAESTCTPRRGDGWHLQQPTGSVYSFPSLPKGCTFGKRAGRLKSHLLGLNPARQQRLTTPNTPLVTRWVLAPSLPDGLRQRPSPGVFLRIT